MPAQSHCLDARAQRTLLILLCLSVLINYMDRGSLGVAAPAMMSDLHFDPSHMGTLLSAFFWTYALFQIVAGWLVDRYDVKYVYAAGFVFWTVAMISTGVVTSFATLLLVRLMLGIGEAVAYPSYSRILSFGFPETRRGFANAIIDFGTKIAPAIGTRLAFIIEDHGWRLFFISIGVASMVWLLPWMLLAPRIKPKQGEVQQAPPLTEILRKRAAWATFFGLLGFNYAMFFFLTWMPSWLVNERHYTTSEMSIYGALPYCVTAFSAVTWGWLSDRWIEHGKAVDRVRKPIVIAGLLLAAAMIPLALVPDRTLSTAALLVGFFGLGMYTSNCWAITQSLAGESAAGKWTGLQNCVGNFGGILAPLVTGWVVKEFGAYQYAFYAVSVMLVMGASMYAFVLGPIQRIQWYQRPVTTSGKF